MNQLPKLNLPGVEVQNGVFVPFVGTGTNLGAVMDSQLIWKPQVDVVSRKVNRALYGLRSSRSCTTEAFHKQLAAALAITALLCTLMCPGSSRHDCRDHKMHV